MDGVEASEVFIGRFGRTIAGKWVDLLWILRRFVAVFWSLVVVHTLLYSEHAMTCVE